MRRLLLNTHRQLHARYSYSRPPFVSDTLPPFSFFPMGKKEEEEKKKKKDQKVKIVREDKSIMDDFARQLLIKAHNDSSQNSNQYPNTNGEDDDIQHSDDDTHHSYFDVSPQAKGETSELLDMLRASFASRNSELQNKNCESMESVKKLDFITLVKIYANDKLMAGLLKELEFLRGKIPANDKLMAENLELIRKLEYQNEELVEDNLAQVKKLDFSLGFNALDESLAETLEVFRDVDRSLRKLDPRKIKGDDDFEEVNAEPMADFEFELNRITSPNDYLMLDNFELVKELDSVLKNIDAVDNFKLAKVLDLAIRIINKNNKKMAFNLEADKICDSIFKKIEANLEDELMIRLDRGFKDFPVSELVSGTDWEKPDFTNYEEMAENLEVVRKLDFAFEEIDVNNKWMADNLELIRKLHFAIGKINANDQVIKENLELVKKCHNANDQLKADNLDLIRKSQVALGKIIEKDELVADNLDIDRESQVTRGEINAINEMKAG